MFKVKTGSRTDFIDITSKVQEVVRNSSVQNGICTVFVPHTTSGVTINENADPAVELDLKKITDKLIPWEDGYKHLEGNSAAHMKTSLFGSSEQIIIENNSLVLGTWQGIYLCEFDGPRTRKVLVKIIEG